MSKSKPKPKKSRTPPKPARRAAPKGAGAVPPGGGGPDLRRLLRDMPALLFEPEFRDVAFDEDELHQAHQERLSDPNVIARLADQALLARLLICINNLQGRAHTDANEKLLFLANAARFYIEQYRGPAWDNPLVVALYQRTLAARAGETLTRAGLKAAVKSYEHTSREELQQKWQALELLSRK